MYFFRLISQLEGRVKTVGEEISSLEGVDRRVEVSIIIIIIIIIISIIITLHNTQSH